MRRTGTKIIAGLLLIAILFLGANCYSVNIKEQEKELTPIKVRLSWLHTAEFSGLYMAEKLGYYEEEGLNVSLEPYDFEKTAVDYVSEGDSQIGFGGSPEILLARSNNKKVKAIFSLFQVSPDVFISLEDSKIIKPEDLNGKTIGLSCYSNTEYQERAFLRKFNINFTETCSQYAINQLLEGNADAIGGFITNEPIIFKKQGYEINTILINDYGVDIYPNLIFTSEEYIESNYDDILKFLRATGKGIKFSIEYPEDAVEETLKYDASLDREHQLKTLESQTPLIFSGENPIGWIEKQKLERTQDVLLEQNILDTGIDIENAYTMQFLEKIYGKQTDGE